MHQYPICAAVYYATATALSDGGFLCMSDDWQAPAGWTQVTRPWFTGALSARGEIYANEPYENVRFGTACISFSRAVFGANGQVSGVVGCDIPLSALSQAIEGVDISPNTVANVVDQKGMYLTNADTSAIMTRTFFADAGLDTRKYNVAPLLDGIRHGFVEKSSFCSVKKLAASPWFIVMYGPVKDFTGSLVIAFNVIILVTIFLILCCVALNVHLQNKTNAKESRVSAQLITETQSLVVAAKRTPPPARTRARRSRKSSPQ